MSRDIYVLPAPAGYWSIELVEIKTSEQTVDVAPKRYHWTEDAHCLGIEDIPSILIRCTGCPVQAKCLRAGVTERRSGPYGGLVLKKGRLSTGRPDW